jgi:uncharacterized protein YlzI (FlbEa/FlbD family)
MFAEFTDINGNIVYVVPQHVQAIATQQYAIGAKEGTDIICLGGKLIVSETPAEVIKELYKVAEEIRKLNCTSLT